jgi:crotonobetainyl-CoA:carnitine CoA-transferase CaiB-like acyl-CoA transferase
LGHPPARLGLRHALVAPYGAYTTGDGEQILIAVQNNREWRAFCDQVLGQPMLGTDLRFMNNPERVANRGALDGAIDAVFGRETRARLLLALDTARIACAPLNSVEDLSNHPLLRNIPVDFAGSGLSVADLPIQSDAGRAREVPDLDQHGPQIRKEFGG